MMKKTFFNPELNTYDTYTDTWIVEKVSVKDEKDLLVLNHYWCDSDGELWGDFENPMENVYRSFDAYRERKGWMTPKEIKDLRKSLGFSVRKFADALGISTSTLTQIENNHRVQAKYQEILFRGVQSNPAKFKEILKKKENDLNTKIKENSSYNLNIPFGNLSTNCQNDGYEFFINSKSLGDAA